MTKEEELERYIYDRDCLEQQIDGDTQIMKDIEAETDDYESHPEWNYAWDEVTAAQNEIASIESAIEDLMDRS